MRILSFFMIIVVGQSVLAQNWRKAFECENGAVVIDKQFNGMDRGQSYQLVLRDNEAIKYMVQKGAIPKKRINQKGEAILLMEPKIDFSNPVYRFISEGDAYSEGSNGRVHFILGHPPRLTVTSHAVHQPHPAGPYVLGPIVAMLVFNNCGHVRGH